ncbi:FHA domain-containing protein PS1 [Sesamum alatum]|uniref:FHA domain-containing protein PS1 n=1 Tax=Sesamum alatum TaxID=300844 RepID=A0AAE1XK52_9LAMI|nr:FHA domain-containing protein PS1 [Sesamum alatum]
MAENQEHTKPEEREIPVFTVLKNNCILKNIFLLDNPPSISSSSSSLSVAKNADQEPEMEETLLVGRHPDCHIKLEHPSISRFHLRIHSIPSSRSLFVTDLSSVHGTWISGTRIEPGVRMRLNNSDTLRFGASSRLYRLNWVPLSSAYDIDKPFVPQFDAADTIEEETEGAMDQDENSLFYRNDDHVQTLSDNMEGIELLSDEDRGLLFQEVSPTAPLVPEDLNNSFSNDEEEVNNGSPGICDQENELFSSQLCQFEKENSTPRAVNTETFGMNSGKKSGLSIWSRRGKPECVQIQTSRSRGNCARINVTSQVKSLIHENYRSESILNANCASPDNNEETFTPDKENISPKSRLVRPLKSKGKETLKSESILKISISSVDQDEEEIYTPDKENMTPKSHLLRSMKNTGELEEVKHPKSYRSSPLKSTNISNMYQDEPMLPTLDKAGQHRQVLQERRPLSSESKSHDRSKKQSAVLKARADRDPFNPLSVDSPSNKNKASSKPSVHEETKRGSRSINYPDSVQVHRSHNNTMKVVKNRWIIVVDTACLLNKKSRKELQLLRGLRGTTLVVPRIVVRELDCMLRRGSFFTRMTEVSAALQWIEECMAVAKWWIHIQSSADEGRLIPPTPPASPHWSGEDKGAFPVGSIPFSPYSLQEIVTPTAADHILECALFFKQTRKNGQLVLLSDDVTLKIKAMAEGVVCETAQEFRGSLVNPFSSRFLYSDSSPIGPSWSCFDDVVLKEKYYPSPSKKLSKSGEGAKGLKLILLHNSKFRQINPVSQTTLT